MERVRLTLQQKQYLVSELKDVVDNYEVYELDSPNDYATILSILTTHFSEVEIDEFLTSYFEEVLSKTN